MKKEITTITAAEAATNTNINNQEEKNMKKELFAAETATTENIKNQEEKVMKKEIKLEKENKVQEEEDMEERKELEEKKQEIISSVESWYEGCYDAIYDLTKSVKNTNKYSRNRDTIEARKLGQCWKLMGYSRGDGDEREADFDTIRNAVIDYLREQPLEYFEDMDDPFNEDSMLDIIDDAYNYADFELPERPDRKEEWLEFVRTCPADWFDYADDPEQERENLIDMYEDWDDVVFCDFDYAVNGDYSDPYTTMRDDA